MVHPRAEALARGEESVRIVKAFRSLRQDNHLFALVHSAQPELLEAHFGQYVPIHSVHPFPGFACSSAFGVVLVCRMDCEVIAAMASCFETTSPYLLSMSKRFAWCGARCLSPTHSLTTMGRKPCCTEQPARITVSIPPAVQCGRKAGTEEGAGMLLDDDQFALNARNRSTELGDGRTFHHRLHHGRLANPHAARTSDPQIRSLLLEGAIDRLRARTGP
jgi:hypothetical protein